MFKAVQVLDLSLPLSFTCQLFVCYNYQIIITTITLHKCILDKLKIRKIKDSILPLFIPSATLFFMYIGFLPVSYFLLPEEGTLFTGQICQWWISQIFVFLRKFLSLLLFWSMILQDMGGRRQFFTSRVSVNRLSKRSKCSML